MCDSNCCYFQMSSKIIKMAYSLRRMVEEAKEQSRIESEQRQKRDREQAVLTQVACSRYGFQCSMLKSNNPAAM